MVSTTVYLSLSLAQRQSPCLPGPKMRESNYRVQPSQVAGSHPQVASSYVSFYHPSASGDSSGIDPLPGQDQAFPGRSCPSSVIHWSGAPAVFRPFAPAGDGSGWACVMPTLGGAQRHGFFGQMILSHGLLLSKSRHLATTSQWT